MKRYFNYNNDDYDILKTGTIGAAATITHDLFIAPSDSKLSDFANPVSLYSGQTETLTKARPAGMGVRQTDNTRGGSISALSVLPRHCPHEYSFHDDCGLCE